MQLLLWPKAVEVGVVKVVEGEKLAQVFFLSKLQWN